MSKKNLFSLYTVGFLIISILAYLYFFRVTKKELADNNYKYADYILRKNLHGMIDDKKKESLNLAFTIANHDKNLIEFIQKKEFPSDYYTNLTNFYKDYFIEIFDVNGKSIYKSNRDELNRLDTIDDILSGKKSISYIDIEKEKLSVNSLVGVFKDKKFIGLVRVKTNFNSIYERLKDMGIEPIFISKKSIENNSKFFKYLVKDNMKHYFNNSYKIEDGYLVSSYLVQNESKVIGLYLMFKKLSDISFYDNNNFMSKLILFVLFIIIAITFFVNSRMFIAKKKKMYYKNLINSSSNVVLTNDGKKLIHANKTFFNYFKEYDSLEDFLKVYSCICEFFVKENGYLQKEMSGMSWISYLLKNQDQDNKVKMDINGKTYYFLLSASEVAESPLRIAIFLSDITKQEIYKHELEDITITDSLTGIKNRRFYETSMKHEISHACRYEEELAVIMFDIDHFKRVNDEYGHDIGDKVLIEYTKLIFLNLRETDIFCRIGGEEFVIIAPHTSRDDAYKLAQKIRLEVEEYKRVLPITMSFGVTAMVDCENKDDIFKRADEALYEAKNSGRNVVVVK